DPLTSFGGVDGVLPGRNKEESLWIRELIIRISYPHTGNFWRNLPEGIEEVLGALVTREDLRRISNAADPHAIPGWGLATEFLELYAHVALALTQCLDAFHAFLWVEKPGFQLDPGWKLIRAMEICQSAPRLLITIGVWKERLRNGQLRLERYLLALRGIWITDERVRFPELASTISEIRTHEGSGSGATEVGKYLQRPEY
ncbi:hypothetical protein BDZ89DRAFT_925539, partial [Hymenopellis radicata]